MNLFLVNLIGNKCFRNVNCVLKIRVDFLLKNKCLITVNCPSLCNNNGTTCHPKDTVSRLIFFPPKSHIKFVAMNSYLQRLSFCMSLYSRCVGGHKVTLCMFCWALLTIDEIFLPLRSITNSLHFSSFCCMLRTSL